MAWITNSILFDFPISRFRYHYLISFHIIYSSYTFHLYPYTPTQSHKSTQIYHITFKINFSLLSAKFCPTFSLISHPSLSSNLHHQHNFPQFSLISHPSYSLPPPAPLLPPSISPILPPAFGSLPIIFRPKSSSPNLHRLHHRQTLLRPPAQSRWFCCCWRGARPQS